MEQNVTLDHSVTLLSLTGLFDWLQATQGITLRQLHSHGICSPGCTVCSDANSSMRRACSRVSGTQALVA